MTEQPLDPDTDGAVMAELFDAIGFKVTDEDSYNLLVECVESHGQRSRAERASASLHGRCWKLGDGLEVWSIIYEQDGQWYYADCRPAFRSRYVRHVLPWELIEYEEDGEAIVRGFLEGEAEIAFELQNITEINQGVFRQPYLHVALAGLAYIARIIPLPASAPSVKGAIYLFEPAEQTGAVSDEFCENDYLISGRVLAWRELRNPITSTDLVWMHVDVESARLEVLVNRDALDGQPKVGAWLTANVWLQGYVLEEAEILARYEGVDLDYETGDFWAKLKRDN